MLASEIEQIPFVFLPDNIILKALVRLYVYFT